MTLNCIGTLLRLLYKFVYHISGEILTFIHICSKHRDTGCARENRTKVRGA
jgi:hypothetical protein